MEINSNLIKELFRPKFGHFDQCSFSVIQDGLAKRTFQVQVCGKTFILQIWDEPDHGLTNNDNDSDLAIFNPTLENFLAAHEFLESLSIRTPEILYSNNYRDVIPYDYAVLEFISGGNLFDNQSRFSDENLLFKIGDIFGKINEITRDRPGLLIGNDKSYDLLQAFLNSNLGNIKIGSEFNDYVKKNGNLIQSKLEELVSGISKRDYYSLIHGDFKPNHFLFDNNGEITIIDYDGLQFFDLEYEYAQFVIPSFSFANCNAFHQGYFKNRKINLDNSRLLFYKVYQAVSGLAFCSEWLSKNGRNELYEKIVKSNEESIAFDLFNARVNP